MYIHKPVGPENFMSAVVLFHSMVNGAVNFPR